MAKQKELKAYLLLIDWIAEQEFNDAEIRGVTRVVAELYGKTIESVTAMIVAKSFQKELQGRVNRENK